MEFHDIVEEDTVHEGEYLFHVPSKTVVLCGTFSRETDEVSALKNGKMIRDSIVNFQKITVPRAEHYRTSGSKRRGCGGCKGS